MVRWRYGFHASQEAAQRERAAANGYLEDYEKQRLTYLYRYQNYAIDCYEYEVDKWMWNDFEREDAEQEFPFPHPRCYREFDDLPPHVQQLYDPPVGWIAPKRVNEESDMSGPWPALPSQVSVPVHFHRPEQPVASVKRPISTAFLPPLETSAPARALDIIQPRALEHDLHSTARSVYLPTHSRELPSFPPPSETYYRAANPVLSSAAKSHSVANTRSLTPSIYQPAAVDRVDDLRGRSTGSETPSIEGPPRARQSAQVYEAAEITFQPGRPLTGPMLFQYLPATAAFPEIDRSDQDNDLDFSTQGSPMSSPTSQDSTGDTQTCTVTQLSDGSLLFSLTMIISGSATESPPSSEALSDDYPSLDDWQDPSLTRRQDADEAFQINLAAFEPLEGELDDDGSLAWWHRYNRLW